MANPVINLSIIYALGIIFNLILFNSLKYNIILLFLLILIILFFYLREERLKLNIFLYLGFFILGGVSYKINSIFDYHNHISNYLGRNVEIWGFVEGFPSKEGRYLSFLFKPEKLRLNRFKIDKIKGKIKLLIREGIIKKDLRYGDRLNIWGRLSKIGGRDPKWRRYYFSQDIYGVLKIKEGENIKCLKEKGGNLLKRFSFYLKGRLIEIQNKILKKPKNFILRGILLGERKIVPLEIKNLFQDIGIAHILAVSGLHVGFIFIFFFSIFRFLHLNEEISRLLCLFFIFLYALITGFKPSVARASLMIAFLIIAPLFYRKSSSISNLFLAFWVLLLLNPLLIYNIGFQLSFIATLGILIFTPILGEYFQGRFKKLVIFVAVSISAWLSILPLLLHYFHKISLLAIFINILAIPLVALIVWFGFISFLLFNLSPYLGEILGSINSTLIDLLLFITQKFESIPFGVIYVSEFSLPFIIVYYIIFLALAIYLMNIISQKVDLPKFA